MWRRERERGVKKVGFLELETAKVDPIANSPAQTEVHCIHIGMKQKM